MKKILLLSGTLLSPTVLLAQPDVMGKYILESHCKIKPANDNYGDDCKNNVKIDIHFTGGIVKTILNEQLNSIPENPFTDYGVKFDSLDAVPGFAPVKMFTTASRNWRRTIGGCGGNGSFNDTDPGSYRERTINFCNNSFYNSDAVRWWNHDLSIKVYPKLVIQDPNGVIDNFLSTDDAVTIKSHYGFRTIDYKWQYSTNGVTYTTLPQYNGMSAITVNAYDILGSGAETYIGNFIQLRQISDCGSYSNIVEYKVLKSAPKLLSHGPAIKTTCYDTDDGEYKLYFDRPLIMAANEYLSFNLIDPVTQQPVATNFLNITQLQAGNTFNLTGLPAGDYELRIIGKYNGIDIYSPTAANPVTFTITRNAPVDFSLVKTDVWCYNGMDGAIAITASGGTLSNYAYQVNNGSWTPFVNTAGNAHTLQDLVAGVYVIKVRDGNQCVAKLQSTDIYGNTVLGIEKELTSTLTAPTDSLSITYTLLQEPTFSGATNGKIVAKVDGGTIFDNNTYWYEWKNAQGQTIPATTQFTTGSFYITLDNVPANTYFLTIRDKHYTNATDKNNCTVVESEIELAQPEPLTAAINVVREISCNVNNTFGNETDLYPYDGQRDESQNGIIKVIAEGGKPFTGTQNGGKPYKYTWKRQNIGGTWDILPGTADSIIQLAEGNYAVNIEDANGIVIGTYVNNVLVQANDVTYYLPQPSKLNLSFDSLAATCAGGDGYAKAHVSGGVPPYAYSWSNGAVTEEINNLVSMPYFVNITDNKGCRIQGTVQVTQPEFVSITENIRPLLCHNASDAAITISVNGGTLPYSYQWNTGATTADLQNLSAGVYTLTLTDGQGCVYNKQYIIENPEEIIIDLGENRTLCIGQALDLDATLLQHPGSDYAWHSGNGFAATTPTVTLSDAGTYIVTATTPQGCIIRDTIAIQRSEVDIDAEFLLTTQAFVNEEVVLVNVSNPKGQSTQWLFDQTGITTVESGDDFIIIKMAEAGAYPISLKQTQGDCYMTFDKTIVVEPNNGMYNPVNTNKGFVKSFTVAPNPSNGNFNVIVELEGNSPVKLRLLNTNGQVANGERSLPEAKVHSANYNIGLQPGVYILVLETPYQVLTKKINIF